jgi:hypothetical protein
LAKYLRFFKKGKLLNQMIRKEEYCPQDLSKIFKNGNHTQMSIAFLAGNQIRINQLTFIIVLYHLLLLRNS